MRRLGEGKLAEMEADRLGSDGAWGGGRSGRWKGWERVELSPLEH